MSTVDFVKNNITEDMFVDVLRKYGANNLRKIGDIYRCSCPIHGGDNDTAFTFNPSNMLFNCFTECGGGDVFDFIAMVNDIDIETDFVKAIRQTAKEFGINIDGLDLKNVEYSYKKDILDYLRYINGKKEIFNKPYNLNTLGSRYALNEYRGIKKEDLIKYGVSFANDMNRICFEIKDDKGEVVGASLRAVGDEKPKWIHRPKSIKTGMLLYNLNNIDNTQYNSVYVVEGILDCINMIQLGFVNTVCTFGARITPEQMIILMGRFEEVTLAFDNDEAGINAIKKSIDKYRKVINIFVLLYDKKDPGELVKEDLENICEVPWYEYGKEK